MIRTLVSRSLLCTGFPPPLLINQFEKWISEVTHLNILTKTAYLKRRACIINFVSVAKDLKRL